ncbi:MAG: amidohydrolase family protein [Lautropia sp.]
MQALPVDPPPDPRPRSCGFAVPAGACDAHFHVFPGSDAYPRSPARAYDPALATDADYRTLMRSLGLQRAVLVHPTTYGTDNRLLVDVLRANPDYRGIAVVDLQADGRQLDMLREAGVRGIRITAVAGGGVPLDQMDALASRIAPLDWHLQLFTRAETMQQLAPRLPRLPVPVVLDHLGGLSAADGDGSDALDTVLRLLATGRVWVKLSGAYRASASGLPYRDTIALGRALVQAAPDRLVWGSDWPHPNRRGQPMPNDGDLLALLAEWAPDERVRSRILVDNAAALYGF